LKVEKGTLKHKVYVQYSAGEAPDGADKNFPIKAVHAVLQHEAVDMPCIVSILISDDKGIRKYNNEYRGVDKATDVLSFPMQEFLHAGWNGRGEMEPDKDTGDLPLGDIILSSESVIRQAKEYGNTIEYEAVYLTIHSTLHLLGYDHAKKENEKIMHDKCRAIIEEMGFAAQ